MDQEQTGRRAHPRVPVLLQVAYRSAGSFLVSYSLNLSKGGLFLESTSPLPPGTELTLQLSVPGTPGQTTLSGRVAWIRQEGDESGPPGMGVAFSDLDGRVGRIIDGLVGSFQGIRILLLTGTTTRSRAHLASHLRSLLTCKVVEVHTADRAVEELTFRVDLAVLDLDRAPEEGILFLERFSSSTENKAPLVALAVDQKLREQAKQLGATYILSTFGPPAEFRATVLKALSQPVVS